MITHEPQPLRFLRFLALAAGLTVLAGCSGGGGGGGGAAAPAAPGALGEREVPGYRISAQRTAGTALPGDTVTVEATVTPVDGATAPVAVQALLATEPTWEQAVAGQDLGTGRYVWTASLPTGTADLRLWVRITDAAGNVMETGGEDFPLR